MQPTPAPRSWKALRKGYKRVTVKGLVMVKEMETETDLEKGKD
jgi:hypothetical protein